MGVPRLAAGEKVVLDLRPHLKVLVRPALAVPVVCGLGAFGAAAVPAGGYRAAGRLAILVVGVLLLLRYAVLPWLRWLSTHVVLTTDRIMVRTGMLGRRGRDLPLRAITEVWFAHSLVERLLRCGTLVVEAAGERGQLVLPDLASVEQLQHEVYRLIDDDDRRRRIAAPL